MKWTALLASLPLVLSAEVSTSSITSKNASFDGKTLVLNGDVFLNHGLGTMRAQAARILKGNDDEAFSSIHLFDDVLITLKNHGRIYCAKANFDFESLQGELIPKLGEFIRLEKLTGKDLSLSSHLAHMTFSKMGDAFTIKKLTAEDEVFIEYGQNISLTADAATFEGDSVPKLSATSQCVLNYYGDTIEAKKVEFFPKASKVVASSPSGTLSMKEHSPLESLQFSCDTLVWEQIPGLLTLRGDVAIEDKGIGHIHCDEEVELQKLEKEGKSVITSITAKGYTEVSYRPGNAAKHLLICHGIARIDQDRLVLTMESPAQLPIEYYHGSMKLSADSGQLSYKEIDETVTPEQLILSGNIRLTPATDILRCAVADQFTYFPLEEEMILSSDSGNNVLFWDEERELTISAQQIHIIKKASREVVKGVGNVRFVFSSAENELLKKLFPFYKTKEGNQ